MDQNKNDVRLQEMKHDFLLILDSLDSHDERLNFITDFLGKQGNYIHKGYTVDERIVAGKFVGFVSQLLEHTLSDEAEKRVIEHKIKLSRIAIDKIDSYYEQTPKDNLYRVDRSDIERAADFLRIINTLNGHGLLTKETGLKALNTWKISKWKQWKQIAAIQDFVNILGDISGTVKSDYIGTCIFHLGFHVSIEQVLDNTSSAFVHVDGWPSYRESFDIFTELVNFNSLKEEAEKNKVLPTKEEQKQRKRHLNGDGYELSDEHDEDFEEIEEFWVGAWVTEFENAIEIADGIGDVAKRIGAMLVEAGEKHDSMGLKINKRKAERFIRYICERMREYI